MFQWLGKEADKDGPGVMWALLASLGTEQSHKAQPNLEGIKLTKKWKQSGDGKMQWNTSPCKNLHLVCVGGH